MGQCAEEDNRIVKISIVLLIFGTRMVLFLVSSSRLCRLYRGQCVGHVYPGASVYSWLLPLGGLWAISLLQAVGRPSLAAVHTNLIAVDCDQIVQ